jgi:hypothetical protein
VADRFNYLAPVMKCQMEAKSGTVLDFKAWSSSYNSQPDLLPVLGANLAPINYPFLTELSVTLAGMGIDAARGAVMTNSISLTIEPPYQQWVDLIEEYIDVFIDGTIVRVQLGYSGGEDGFLSEEFVGVLSNVTCDLAPDFVSMSVQAMGNAWYMTRRQGVLNTEGRTILAVLLEILDSHGLKLFHLDDEGREVKISSSSVPATLKSLNNTLSEVVEGDDYNMVLKLVQNQANLDFYTMGSRVIIYSQDAQAQQSFIPTFVYRGGPTQGKLPIENGVYPCLTFSNANTQSVIKRAAAKVESQVTNLDTKTEETISILKEHLGLAWHRIYGPADVVDPASGSALGGDVGGVVAGIGEGLGIVDDNTVAASKPFRADQRGMYVPLGSNDPSGREKLIGLRRLAVGLSGLESSWSTLGNPLLRPGMDANLRGVSRLFEGRYNLTKIVHSGSLSGYETQVDGKTIGKHNVEAAGSEDTKGKTSQAADPETQEGGTGIDTQVKVPST